MILMEKEEEERIRAAGIKGTEEGRKSRGMIADFASYNKTLPRQENDGINTFVRNTIEDYLVSNLERHEIGVTQLCGISEVEYSRIQSAINQRLESEGGRFYIRIYENYVNVPLPFFKNPVLIADMIIFDNDNAHLGENKKELQLAETI